MGNAAVNITREKLSQSDLETLLLYAQEANMDYTTKDVQGDVERYQDYASKKVKGDSLYMPISDFNDFVAFSNISRRVQMATSLSKTNAFSENLRKVRPTLTMVLTSECDKYENEKLRCHHCYVGESKPEHMSFNDIEGVDLEFLKLFNSFDFTLEGEPFLYKSPEGKDISDVISYLANIGKNEFDISTGVFLRENPRYNEVTSKLALLKKSHPELSINTRLTYHSLVDSQLDFDIAFANAFLKQSFFADLINVKLISAEGSNFNEEELSQRLKQIFNIMLENLEVTKLNKSLFEVKTSDRKFILGNYWESGLANLGEYTKTLERIGKLSTYPSSIAPPLCENSLIPENIILLPNGQTSLCQRPYYRVFKRGYNLFTKGSQGFLDFLERRYTVQLEHFEKRFEEIVTGKHKYAPCANINKIPIVHAK